MKKKILSVVTIFLLVAAIPFSSFAHSGRTDGSGGHKDNKNKSGLGGYHYHCGGYPAHLHTGGVCPYRGGGSSYSSTPKTVYASRINAVSVPNKINDGEEMQLKASVYPSNATDSTITWESSDPSILSVSSSGMLKANGVGTATITAKTSRGTSSKFTITVNEVVAESIEIENKTTEMLMEETIVLSVLFTPENTSDKTIEWSSDNEDIAVVSDDGTLEAVGVGSTTITAVHKEFMDSFDIEVKPIEADKVEIEYPIDAESEESAPRVKKGETMQLTAIITPDNTTDKTIKWSVDNESIAEIDDDGILTALGTGMVIVTAESNNGKTAEIEIELYSNTAAGVAGVGSVVAIAAGVIYFLKRKKSKNNIE